MMKNAASFDTGGVVPEDGMGMLHQNEVILPTGLVDSLKGGKQAPASNVVTLNANITVNGGADSGKKIIDQMFSEIRKRSANQKIMFETGLIK
jgi:hypothetical protein